MYLDYKWNSVWIELKFVSLALATIKSRTYYLTMTFRSLDLCIYISCFFHFCLIIDSYDDSYENNALAVNVDAAKRTRGETTATSRQVKKMYTTSLTNSIDSLSWFEAHTKKFVAFENTPYAATYNLLPCSRPFYF